MVKKFARILLGFILLLIVVGVILLQSINTEQNKAAIQAAVLSTTGYELTIAGDMDINFFPSIGLTLNDVRLKNPAATQELASTNAALLKVDLRALIGGELLIKELSINDFHINYYIDAAGKSNWDVSETSGDRNFVAGNVGSDEIQQTSSVSSPTNAQSSDENIVTVSFERLEINNANIDIQDLSQGTRYSINNVGLSSANTNLEGRPFGIDIHFDFLNNGMSKPIAMSLSGDVTADINAGNISIEKINFNLTPMSIQGEIEISNLNKDVSFQGSLESNSFDVLGLMEAFGSKEPEADFVLASSSIANSQRPQINWQFGFSGDPLGIEIPNLLLQLADTELAAEANVRFATDFTPANISYEITSNRIDLSPFLVGSESNESSNSEANADLLPAAATAASNAEVRNTNGSAGTDIPSELLNSFNVLGSISIESITANGMEFSDINVFTNVEDGVLDIEIQPISVFSGSLQGNIRLDGRGENADLSTQLSISQLNIVELAPNISRLNSVTGNLDAEISYTATGSDTKALQDTLSGSTSFEITENSVDIGVIKQIFTTISALSPSGGTIEQWPDVIRFAELSGYILLENGVSENQQLKLRMDNFDISGSGGLNLEQETFGYNLLFTVLGEPYPQTISVDDLYHDVSWPVECAATFADEVSQYCRPDFTQVREIFTQIGTNAARSRLNEVITDQLPPEVRDGARRLLRNLLN